MTLTDKNIVAAYSDLLENLSPGAKLQLIERLSKSLQKEQNKNEDDFYKSFGAFASGKTAAEIVNEIRAERKFRKKEIKL